MKNILIIFLFTSTFTWQSTANEILKQCQQAFSTKSTKQDSTFKQDNAVKQAKIVAVEAQFYFGLSLYNNKNYSQARYWLEQAANQGHAEAQFYFGLMHDNGQGAPKDYSQALYWYEKAALQNLAAAQNNFGVMYHQGKGVSKDYKKARHWFVQATLQDFAVAQYNNEIMIYNDKRDLEDNVYAHDFLNLDAHNGFEKVIKTEDLVATLEILDRLANVKKIFKQTSKKINQKKAIPTIKMPTPPAEQSTAPAIKQPMLPVKPLMFLVKNPLGIPIKKPIIPPIKMPTPPAEQLIAPTIK